MVNDSLKRKLSLDMPVLVVDDSRVTCELVMKILRAIGFRENQFRLGGAEALPELRSLRYGLLLTDLEMSPMSGVDLIKCIRSDKYISALPVVLMTGNRSEAARMTLQHVVSDADIHILKPFTPDTLIKKLESKFVVEQKVLS
jgi:two-component system, chemotaxis family, chemotaxis protein CheY